MKSVLITGTSKGIGLETALAFGRAGCRVFATMRNPAHAPALAEAAKRERLPITISVMDVDSDQSVRQAVNAIQQHGPIDVLVNNAGLERAGSVEEVPLSEFRAAIETNYLGAIRCIQGVLPQMRQRRAGCIINVTSVSGLIASPGLSAYAASKWALEALSEALAGEVKAFGVRVAIVEPGIIDTSMARRIEAPASDSPYLHRARLSTLFQASLKKPVPPSLVAQKILEIAGGDGWQLRHLVGPDAPGFIAWRRNLTDEEWVSLGASDDETYFRSIQRDFPARAVPSR